MTKPQIIAELKRIATKIEANAEAIAPGPEERFPSASAVRDSAAFAAFNSDAKELRMFISWLVLTEKAGN